MQHIICITFYLLCTNSQLSADISFCWMHMSGIKYRISQFFCQCSFGVHLDMYLDTYIQNKCSLHCTPIHLTFSLCNSRSSIQHIDIKFYLLIYKQKSPFRRQGRFPRGQQQICSRIKYQFVWPHARNLLCTLIPQRYTGLQLNTFEPNVVRTILLLLLFFAAVGGSLMLCPFLIPAGLSVHVRVLRLAWCGSVRTKYTIYCRHWDWKRECCAQRLNNGR